MTAAKKKCLRLKGESVYRIAGERANSRPRKYDPPLAYTPF